MFQKIFFLNKFLTVYTQKKKTVQLKRTKSKKQVYGV